MTTCGVCGRATSTERPHVHHQRTVTGRLRSNEDIVAGLIRRQWEAEKSRLILLGALGGGVVAGGVDAALAGRWVATVMSSVLTLIVGWLWEWRWSVAMRVPGSDKENDG